MGFGSGRRGRAAGIGSTAGAATAFGSAGAGVAARLAAGAGAASRTTSTPRAGVAAAMVSAGTPSHAARGRGQKRSTATMNIIPHENAIRSSPASPVLRARRRLASSSSARGGRGCEVRRGRTDLSTGGGVGVAPGGRVNIGGGVRTGGGVSTGGGVTTGGGVRCAPGGGCVGAILLAGAGVPTGGVMPTPTFILKLLRPR